MLSIAITWRNSNENYLIVALHDIRILRFNNNRTNKHVSIFRIFV